MKYVAPEMKVVMFEAEEVITASVEETTTTTTTIEYDTPDQTFF